MPYHTKLVSYAIFIFILGVGLPACAPQIATAQSEAQIVCAPTSPQSAQGNIYKVTPQTQANDIYQHAVKPIPPDISPQDQQILQEQQIIEARYAALNFLTDEIKRWSACQTIALGDGSEVHITITFIGPELIQAIYLNEIFKHRIFPPDFTSQLQKVLDSIAARNEFVFLVSVAATQYDYSASKENLTTITLPMNDMTMINAAGMEVRHKHNDGILEQTINLSYGPAYGYLAYPMAIKVNENCTWVLDLIYDTSITVSISNIKVNGQDYSPQIWSIPYESLIDPNIPPDAPSFNIPPEFDKSLISPLYAPPIPAVNNSVTNDYWRDMGRFLWEYIAHP